MRIGIPIWNNRISPVLDTASKLLVIEMDHENEAGRFEIFLDEHELTRRCLRIRGMNVDLLICGAVSRPFCSMLEASGINIIQDISGHPEDVLQAYLGNKLAHSGLMMPGCRGSNQKYGKRFFNKTRKRTRNTNTKPKP